MAKIAGIPSIGLEITLLLNESEARALDALAGYGDDTFVKAFYDTLGKAYMEQHEAGLRSLLKTVRIIMPMWLARVDLARKAFEK